MLAAGKIFHEAHDKAVLGVGLDDQSCHAASVNAADYEVGLEGGA